MLPESGYIRVRLAPREGGAGGLGALVGDRNFVYSSRFVRRVRSRVYPSRILLMKARLETTVEIFKFETLSQRSKIKIYSFQ